MPTHSTIEQRSDELDQRSQNLLETMEANLQLIQQYGDRKDEISLINANLIAQTLIYLGDCIRMNK